MRHNPPSVQRNFVKLAQTRANLQQTTSTALRILDTLATRGNQLDAVEEVGEALLETSRTFLVQTLPWWKWLLCCYWVPRWWCREEKEEDPFGFVGNSDGKA